MSELKELREALAWIRQKLDLPENVEMFAGGDSIAGKLHNLCFDAHGYQTYIVAFKCDDKQGEIARLTVRAERAEDALRSPPPGDGGLREAIRARMRLYDSQVDPDCIGTGYDVTDIITMSELRQLVGFERAPRKEGE
jgi:hypothetical protein